MYIFGNHKCLNNQLKFLCIDPKMNKTKVYKTRQMF